MQMVQKSFYIEDQVYRDVAQLAKIYQLPTAQLMRQFIKEGILKTKDKVISGTEFLLKLATYHFKGSPKNLARQHDKYTWE